MRKGFSGCCAVLACMTCVAVTLVSGCSSAPPVKRQAYAVRKNHRTFEYDFPTVWKGIEETVRRYRVVSRDPEHVNANEMRRLRRRTLETGWILTRSHDKYIAYKVNGLPRKLYLETRLKYKIEAQSVIGGVKVIVHTHEQIQRLNADGSSAGWETPEHPDTSRASALLDRIKLSILSAAP